MSYPDYPLGIKPEARFAPADGKEYTRQVRSSRLPLAPVSHPWPPDKDRIRCFKEQQPIRQRRLPKHLRPSSDSILQPPVLLFGWAVGHERLMAIVQKEFPEVVRLSRSKDCFEKDSEVDLDDFLDEESDEDDMKMLQDATMTHAELQQRRQQIKNKILAVGRMQRVFQILR